MKWRGIYGCLLLLFFMACRTEENRLDWALREAGENCTELEKVLRHYENDSLKYMAACFLIENMPFHFGYDRTYRQIRDIETLSADYLIENIDLSFQVREKPWNKNLSFADFCRYILPYRCLYELPSGMRRRFMDIYLPLLDSLHPSTTLEASRLVHASLNLTFFKGTPQHYPTVEEIYQTRTGKCDGMLLLSTHIMRAVGIPATIDYTQWSHRDGEHFWGNVLNNDGEFFPYAPENEPPGELKEHLTHKFLTPPVVYRMEFAAESEPVFHVKDTYRTPLKSPLLHLVTTEYSAPTTKVRVACDYPVVSNEGLVYLCNYNNRQWRPLLIGRRKQEQCIFPDVVVDDIFIVAEENAENPGTLHYVTYPFYVGSDGSIRKFFSKDNETDALFIPRDRNDYAEVLPTLTCWDAEKQSFVALDYRCDTLSSGYSLRGLPKNCLFRAIIDRKGKMGGERIFYIQGDSICRY